MKLSILQLPLLLSVGCKAAFPQTRTSKCSTDVITTPYLFGAEILSVSASVVNNYSIDGVQNGVTLKASYTGLNFCNTTVIYTHPGKNDTIVVSIWLPDEWNGRFQGTGGGGWATGYGNISLAPAVASGYSAASTDGGHYTSTTDWALLSPGNVNLYLLQDFASVALSDMTIIGKAVTASFYGKSPDYSYWTGCSTGGRQGLMLAQRYPTLYDGIAAIAPAINWDNLLPALYWPQQVMNRLGMYPPACELNAYTAAATAACDGIDGLVDGIITDENQCNFDALSLVGKAFSCGGVQKIFTSAGATVANAAWTGPTDSSGKKQWYGFDRDAPLSTGSAVTTCAANGSCVGVPFGVSSDWITKFLAKDADYPIANMTNDQYFSFFHQSRQEYAGIIDTSDPDLIAFKSAGGRMITWHGLADRLIPPNGSIDYYQRVQQVVSNTSDFYRLFEAPGVNHCQGGPGPFPIDTLEKLVDWVEHGKAPDTLTAAGLTNGSLPINATGLGVRPLCAWPKKQVFVGGYGRTQDSFRCE